MIGYLLAGGWIAAYLAAVGELIVDLRRQGRRPCDSQDS